MLDVAVAYNRYRFLGSEFLTWLWFMIDTAPDQLSPKKAPNGQLTIGNRIVLENRRNNSSETIRITGDQAGLEEAMVALNKGARVSELNLIYHTEAQKWQFTVKGESLNISGLKIPDPSGRAEGLEESEDFLLDRVDSIETITDLLLALYLQFIRLRLSAHWESKSDRHFKKWISSSIHPSASGNDQ